MSIDETLEKAEKNLRRAENILSALAAEAGAGTPLGQARISEAQAYAVIGSGFANLATAMQAKR